MTVAELLTPTATHLIVLLVGIFIGAAGQYLGQFFTDQRTKKEEIEAELKRFKGVAAVMPALIAEMRTDLLNPKCATSREFFPYNGGAIYAPAPGTLFYDPEAHPDMENFLMILENHGYIANVSHTETARYRMSEAFVALVRESKN